MIKLNKDLVGGSIIFLIAFNIYNVINFAFHFSMARMLTVADYGILATLFSIIYMTAIFSESLQTVIAKYSSGEKDNGKIKNLIKRSIKKSLKISLIIFLVYAFVAIPLTFILKIPYLLLTSTGLMIFAAFISPVIKGAMQGKKKFTLLGINFIIEGTIKLIFALLLVFIGWKVYGAMIATILSAIIGFLFSILVLRDIFKSKEKIIPAKGIYSYSWPVFFILFIIMAFYSIDVIIARIVFDSTTAGYYAIASTFAKTIFFATQPISKVMFPLSAENNGKKRTHIFINSLGIILFCILSVLALFYFFPEFFIKLFSGRYIQESSNILFYIGIAISLISITNLILIYRLSLGKIKNYLIFVIFPIIQIFLLFFFSHNLIEYSIALITANAIFLWGAIFLFDK